MYVMSCAWLAPPAGKLIAAVCHGPAGLVKAKGSDGLPLVNARQVTGFTNSEEEAVGKTKVRHGVEPTRDMSDSACHSF
jgi:putative intracellular protease/amidase